MNGRRALPPDASPPVRPRHDIDPHSQHQNAALHDHLPVCVDVEHRHAVIQARHHQCADQRTVDRSGTATHRGPADKARSDRIEFAHRSRRRRAGREPRGIDDPGERAHQSHQREDGELHAVGIHAGEPRRFQIGTHRINTPPEHGLRRDPRENTQQREQQQNRHGNPAITVERGDKRGQNHARPDYLRDVLPDRHHAQFITLAVTPLAHRQKRQHHKQHDSE